MILYKKDSKGKIRSLELTTEGPDLVNKSGLLDGKKTERRTTCKPKNLGKSNETTAEKQALSELDSKIKEKLREGYFRTQKEAEINEVLLPMLAHTFEDHENKIQFHTDTQKDYPIYAQPKFDGMRCFAICKDGKVTLMSRKNVEITTMQHINDEILLKLYKEGMIYDGELYVHGENFQTNMKYVKKYTKGLSEKIGFYVYDLALDLPFIQRHLMIKNLFETKSLTSIMDVLTVNIRQRKDIDEYHGRFLEEGFEGTMIRHGKDPYKFNGRSSQLLKYKDFKDITCEIIAIGPAKRRPTWGRPVVEWTNPDGKTVRFACGTKMTVEQREELLTNANDYIGKTAEVRYFEEYETGVPRFPVMVGVRLDK